MRIYLLGCLLIAAYLCLCGIQLHSADKADVVGLCHQSGQSACHVADLIRIRKDGLNVFCLYCSV